MGTSLFTFPSSVCLSIFVTGTEQATLSGDLRSWFAQEKEPEGRMLIIRSAAFDFAGKPAELISRKSLRFMRGGEMLFILLLLSRGGEGRHFILIYFSIIIIVKTIKACVNFKKKKKGVNFKKKKKKKKKKKS